MGRATASIPAGYAYGDNTTLRAWGSGISSLMTSAGFLKTADTGQVNWTTVTYANSTYTTFGYEIRKMTNATLGDLYFKIGYATSASASSIYIYYNVGTGTDGAGTLTGSFFGGAGLYNGSAFSNATSSTTSYNGYCYYDSGTFCLALAPSLANPIYSETILFGRTCNADGTYNGNGVINFAPYGSSGNVMLAYPYSFELGQSTSFANSPFYQAYPHYGTYPSIEVSNAGAVIVAEHMTPKLNYHKHAIAVNAADISEGTTFDVEVLGTTHTYRCIGNWMRGVDGGPYNATDTRLALAMIWDA